MRPASQVIQSGRIKPGSGKPDSHSSFPDPHLLKSGRLDLVFKNLPLALGISLLTGFLSVALFWEAAPRQGLLIWFSSLGLISLYRYQMLRAYRKLEGLEKNLDFWEARYTLGAALAGIAWGGLAFLLFRGEPIVFQVFASFILGGMVIGSVVINGPLIRAFLAFTIPTVLPILVRFFLVGETVYSLMGVMTLVFSGTMIGAAFQFRAVFERSMKLGFDNTRMARHLLEEKGRSDYLSKELTSQAWKDRQTQDAVNFVSEKTSGETGKDFLNSLVKHLATVFRVRYAFLMEMNPEDPDRGNVLSFWNGSAFEKPFACPIKGSPLGEVLGGGVIHYPNGVGPMVRGVPGFDGLDLEGFLGFPLVSSEGKVIGQIGLLHHRNLSKNETRLSVLKVFSLRAVSELNRKHFEDDLKLFRTLVDRANDAIFIVDPDTGGFVDVNEKAVDRLGYSRKELLGKKVFDISKGIPDFKAWSALVKRLKEQRSMSLEGVHQRKNGSTFPIEASVSYISIGGGDFLVSVVRDITARREAETVFNRLSRQNELILANSEEGIFGFDLNGRTTFINPAGARMFGWEPEELIGKHQHSVLHHSRADGTTHPVEECPIYAALEDGEVHQARDEVFWRKDGSWFPVEYTSSPIREDGRVTGAVVIFRDDTERKAEEVARFKTILEAAPDAVVGVDQEGVIRLVNTQTERLFGYARSALLGQKVEILLPDRFRESHSQHREKFFKDPKTRAMIGRELAGLRKDGTEFPVDVSLSLVNTDQGELSVSMIRDVTENRKLNEAIRNTVSELQLTVDSIDALVLVVDLEGRVVRCNSRVESFCGLEGTEIIGRLCGDLGNEKPFSAMAELSELVGNSGKPKTIQVREETGSGIWEISANFSGETWSGKPWVIIVARDVTDQVRLQELVHQNKRLTVLGELVSGVSHEVRNPLFSISATLDAFEARFGKREEYARYLEVFRSANQRLLRLMRDLLDLGRPSRLERVPSSFPMVIGKAIEACEPVAASRKVTIVKRGKPEKTSPFLMDPARISQVFQNLIENAVQYSPEGEKVVLEWDEVERDGEAWLECAVLDSGNGFSKDDLKRVFEPFYSRRPGGTGLGMAIVQRIVEEHGGSVAVENQPKSGGCIRVRIPLTGAGEEKGEKSGSRV